MPESRRNTLVRFCQQENSDGIYRSKIFPGRWIDSEALLQTSEDHKVLEALHRGLECSDYADFIENLRKRESGGEGWTFWRIVTEEQTQNHVLLEVQSARLNAACICAFIVR